ncbi:MAG: hypothetical protein ACXWQR_13290 [Ktedonobacterales bacterium]
MANEAKYYGSINLKDIFEYDKFMDMGNNVGEFNVVEQMERASGGRLRFCDGDWWTWHGKTETWLPLGETEVQWLFFSGVSYAGKDSTATVAFVDRVIKLASKTHGWQISKADINNDIPPTIL